MTIKQRFKNWMRSWLLEDSKPVIEELPRTDVDSDGINDDLIAPPDDVTEPWVNIGSTTYDPVKGFRIELDWNDAFIQHLRDGGIVGRSEEEVVQKWLGVLYGELINRLEGTVVERNSDVNRVNDFL